MEAARRRMRPAVGKQRWDVVHPYGKHIRHGIQHSVIVDTALDPVGLQILQRVHFRHLRLLAQTLQHNEQLRRKPMRQPHRVQGIRLRRPWLRRRDVHLHPRLPLPLALLLCLGFLIPVGRIGLIGWAKRLLCMFPPCSGRC